jgi:hypothetical protein
MRPTMGPTVGPTMEPTTPIPTTPIPCEYSYWNSCDCNGRITRTLVSGNPILCTETNTQCDIFEGRWDAHLSPKQSYTNINMTINIYKDSPQNYTDSDRNYNSEFWKIIYDNGNNTGYTIKKSKFNGEYRIYYPDGNIYRIILISTDLIKTDYGIWLTRSPCTPIPTTPIPTTPIPTTPIPTTPIPTTPIPTTPIPTTPIPTTPIPTTPIPTTPIPTTPIPTTPIPTTPIPTTPIPCEYSYWNSSCDCNGRITRELVSGNQNSCTDLNKQCEIFEGRWDGHLNPYNNYIDVIVNIYKDPVENHSGSDRYYNSEFWKMIDDNGNDTGYTIKKSKFNGEYRLYYPDGNNYKIVENSTYQIKTDNGIHLTRSPCTPIPTTPYPTTPMPTTPYPTTPMPTTPYPTTPMPTTPYPTIQYNPYNYNPYDYNTYYYNPYEYNPNGSYKSERT